MPPEQTTDLAGEVSGVDRSAEPRVTADNPRKQTTEAARRVYDRGIKAWLADRKAGRCQPTECWEPREYIIRAIDDALREAWTTGDAAAEVGDRAVLRQIRDVLFEIRDALRGKTGHA